MASSPPYRSPAASPPGLAHSVIPNPRKRGGAPIPGSSLHKRRKPSSFSASSSAHPLRQTSFPPEEALGQGERSPSVDSDYTVNTGANSVAPSATGGKKRPKKKKNGTASVVSAGKGAAGDTASKTGAADEEVDGEEEEGDGGDDDMVDEGGKIDRAAEKKKLA